MELIAVTLRGERRWMLIHRCTRCGRLRGYDDRGACEAPAGTSDASPNAGC
jgi:hypothetical protein